MQQNQNLVGALSGSPVYTHKVSTAMAFPCTSLPPGGRIGRREGKSNPDNPQDLCMLWVVASSSTQPRMAIPRALRYSAKVERDKHTLTSSSSVRLLFASSSPRLWFSDTLFASSSPRLWFSANSSFYIAYSHVIFCCGLGIWVVRPHVLHWIPQAVESC